MSGRSKAAPTRAWGVAAVVLALIVTLGVSCNGFRVDEMECEKAVAHLVECCPGFHPEELNCSYSEDLDCSDRPTARNSPALGLADSACLLARSCDALTASGSCDLAQRARRDRIELDGGTPPVPRERVCSP